VGNYGGVNNLVMVCVEGETLPKRLEKGPLSIDLVLKYGVYFAGAVRKTSNNCFGADFRVGLTGTSTGYSLPTSHPPVLRTRHV
jgi:hypothetical protein